MTLCSGLEKFLGYQETSKGYDGTGIVYSDLDRLCDGVMSFLHGVLESVRDDDNVKTYDTKRLFNDLPASISKLMHKGSNKFQEAITQVSEALGAWSGELERRTDALRDKLTTVSTSKIDIFNSALNDLNNGQPEHVANHLDTCIIRAKELDNAFKEAEEKYNNLDPGLRQKLKDHMHRAKLEVAKFVAAASDDPLKAVVETAGRRLGTLETRVKDHIFHSVKGMQRKIDEEFKNKIQDPITKVKEDLTLVKSNLDTWIDRANDVFAAAFKKVEKIMKVLAGKEGDSEPKKRDAVTTAAYKLQKRADSLRESYELARSQVLDAASKAQQAVDGLTTELKTDLANLKQGITKAVTDYAKGYVGKVREQVEKIRGRTERTETTGLQGFVQHVRDTYANGFKKGEKGFEQKVEGWLDGILEGDTVKEHIKGYAEHTNNSGRFRNGFTTVDEITPKIKDRIMEAIRGDIHTAQSEITELNDKIGDNVKKAYDCMIAFAALLDGGIKGQKRIKATDIVMKIRKDVVSNENGNYEEYQLTRAVDVSIAALVATVNQACNELQLFTGYDGGEQSEIQKVDISYEAAKGLWSNLNDALNGGTSHTLHMSNLSVDIADKLETTINDKVEHCFQMSHPDSGDAGDGIDLGRLAKQYNWQKRHAVDGRWKRMNETIPLLVLTNAKSNGETYISVAEEIAGLHSEFDTAFKAFIQAVERLIKKDNGATQNSLYHYLADLNSIVTENKVCSLESDVTGQAHGLQKIYRDLVKILGNSKVPKPNPDGNITTIVKNAEEFYKTIATQADKVFTDLQSYVTTQVQNATADIQDEAKKQYHGKIHPMFESMKANVSAHVKDINNTIDDDLKSGVKGLLRQVMDHANTGTKSRNNKLDKLKQYTNPKDHESVKNLSNDLREYLKPIVNHVENEAMTPGTPGAKGPASEKQENKVSRKVNEIHGHVGQLLGHLKKNGERKYNYDHDFVKLFQELKTSVSSLSPPTFDGYNNALLSDAIKAGINGFNKELDKAYVNAYAGKEIKTWTEKDGDGRKAAKILVTIMKLLDDDLTDLRHECKNGWKEKRICLVSKPNKPNPLGAFFQDCGYRVSKLEEPYEGELRCQHEMRGGDVFGKLVASLQDVNKIAHLVKCPSFKEITDDVNIIDLLKCLTSHVSEYYQSCHIQIQKSKRYPCSVRDICVWLSGLPHTAVYGKIDGHCDKLLNQEDEATNTFPNQADTVMKRSLDYLHGNIKTLCHLAPKILVSIQGHGSGLNHAAYPYACCLENNHGQFYYPGDPSSLLDMLKDMCSRLLRALCFLYQQCRYTASDGNGWRECQYGYRVGTYQWVCGKSSSEPNTQPKCQPNSEPNGQPKCLPKSPLQAHLMDGLPGFMPHKFTAVGCQPMCSTCPKGSLVGQCITPMGFADLATAGSITGRGEDLIYLLGTLCKNGGSVLCELVHSLQCISPSPPKGLAEMFSYFCNVMQKSYGSLYGHEDTFKGEIDSAINNSFPFRTSLHNDYQPSDLTAKIKELCGPEGKHTAVLLDKSHCDLWSISQNSSTVDLRDCPLKNTTCAPYLKALCHDACHTYPQKHKALYLSWLCRLAWTFWDLLDQLLKAFNNISCQTYGCQCKCGFGKHGVTEEDTSQPPKVPTPPKTSCHCNSIVQCKGVMSTFYLYGFTFGMPKELMASGSKKTCDNFVKQLTRVLHKGYFKDLFDEIDNFIWAIRTPFSYLLLALWSLSLLYLLHIAVVRLDVLRIRSHLKSPSSHRIAAQSLLAAARVRALTNVKYFSP
ncbi:hypothetical protein, conserved [Babesia ovata]|uniref:Extracellular matrix-binding ebh n=1 Tax=Babesia ovata TaxID=189622 RepID=A0A2H6KIY3_9APIC|nr:uncharacterized protein BOVATA_044320 [Babesia ovata]GBE62939.1 hypothetical protein, conserved [Babesia ovata]